MHRPLNMLHNTCKAGERACMQALNVKKSQNVSVYVSLERTRRQQTRGKSCNVVMPICMYDDDEYVSQGMWRRKCGVKCRTKRDQLDGRWVCAANPLVNRSPGLGLSQAWLGPFSQLFKFFST